MDLLQYINIFLILSIKNYQFHFQPRLGPKPFQAKSTSQEFSFDRVFSVPQAPNPNSDSCNGASNGHCHANVENNDIDESPTYEIGRQEAANKSDSSSIEEDANSSDSGYKPKTPSTAERRKLFEAKVLFITMKIL